MPRTILLLLLWVAAVLSWPTQAAAADELPPRPTPFRFVNDQAQLLPAADAKTLENGLRRYADKTGTQIVVVTVPSLGGQDVADYARSLGTAWGIGQREKNNGVVVLLGAQEHKVTIQAGSGLQSQITPELTSRVINQQMTPSFKQGRYFAGLRSGLNALMLAADPNPRPDASAATATTESGAAATGSSGLSAGASGSGLTDELPSQAGPTNPVATPVPVSEPSSSGFGLGTLVLGAVVVLGGIWLVSKLFRRRTPTPEAGPSSNGPDFLPRQPNGPARGGYGGQQPPMQQGGGPNFFPNSGPGLGGGGGSGVGGMLMTGAAAAAGAYLGNRMAQGHDTHDTTAFNPDTAPHNLDPGAAAAGAAGGAVGGGFPALDDSAATPDAGPDYFADDYTSANDSADYFSSDESGSYDDMSSDDTGGGGFDSDDDNSGSW
ncbi:TPM domain-containing protein [Hymenobacter sp. HSC-4F20]|uniref:TPM domain-containing protein n=1 Tax=Hymenobacter sp. HSC-4F20 TaxID=2864135 RepID=UPI001C7313E8|nr:TPM domain-containing protein [Hymenobacter sp. HSC-4F20]MBX0291723.1 TPM domain-containing protein [Hymenobacter sp. HSC-4F20]